MDESGPGRHDGPFYRGRAPVLTSSHQHLHCVLCTGGTVGRDLFPAALLPPVDRRVALRPRSPRRMDVVVGDARLVPMGWTAHLPTVSDRGLPHLRRAPALPIRVLARHCRAIFRDARRCCRGGMVMRRAIHPRCANADRSSGRLLDHHPILLVEQRSRSHGMRHQVSPLRLLRSCETALLLLVCAMGAWSGHTLHACCDLLSARQGARGALGRAEPARDTPGPSAQAAPPAAHPTPHQLTQPPPAVPVPARAAVGWTPQTRRTARGAEGVDPSRRSGSTLFATMRDWTMRPWHASGGPRRHQSATWQVNTARATQALRWAGAESVDPSDLSFFVPQDLPSVDVATWTWECPTACDGPMVGPPPAWWEEPCTCYS
jgi:hypothetical protein